MYVNEKVENSIANLPHGQHKVSCPDCEGTRKKNRRDKPLSVEGYACKQQSGLGLYQLKRNINQS